MKKNIIIAAVLAASLMTTSCIGSFSLSNKLLSWNRSIDNKFVNELVFIAFWILPVYEISGLADILVLNSIEFWSGDNPVKKGTSQIKGEDGTIYKVMCDGKGYTITNTADNSVVRLDFNADSKEWSVIDARGHESVLFGWVDAGHVRMATPDGGYTVVPVSQEGVYAYQQTADATNLACR